MKLIKQDEIRLEISLLLFLLCHTLLLIFHQGDWQGYPRQSGAVGRDPGQRVACPKRYGGH